MTPFIIRNAPRRRSIMRVILPIGLLLFGTSFLQGCTSNGRGYNSAAYYGNGYSAGGNYPYGYSTPRYGRPLFNSFNFGFSGGRHGGFSGGGHGYRGGHR
jgi:hypothetical protein